MELSPDIAVSIPLKKVSRACERQKTPPPLRRFHSTKEGFKDSIYENYLKVDACFHSTKERLNLNITQQSSTKNMLHYKTFSLMCGIVYPP